MKVNFNSINLGLTGGNRVVFELSNRLVDLGYTVTINHANKDYLFEWFSPIKAQILNCQIGLLSKGLNKVGVKHLDVLKEQQKQLLKHMPDCDVNVATSWPTAEPTCMSKKGKSFYLVQHFEPLFFPEGSTLYQQALGTYDYPLQKLCVSDWLAKKVGGCNIGNGLNISKFCRLPNVNKIRNSVMFSYRTPKYKNSDLAKSVSSILVDRGCVVLSSDEHYSDSDMVKLYNQAEVYVNLSDKEGFGLGMLEAMSCGCAVISTPCAEYLDDKVNCHVIPYASTSQSIADAVLDVLAHHDLQVKLVDAGFSTASHFDFEKVVQNFLKAVKQN